MAEHPFGGSWGYQVTSYFAPTARFGTPDEFRLLVDRLHQAGIGVIVDWVPAHFPKDDWALARFDGTPLYEHADPRARRAARLGHVRLRLRPSRGAQLPGRERGVTGSRSSTSTACASTRSPRCSTSTTRARPASGRRTSLRRPREPRGGRVPAGGERDRATSGCPGVVTIAEESTAWPGVTRPTHLGGLGFGLKWNMGWMHDSLAYVAHDPIYRQYHHHQMTFSMMYAYTENYVLPLSHDEVVHGKGSLLRKMPGDRWQQLANLRAYLAYMWAHPGKQLIFMGIELAPGVGVGGEPRARLVAARPRRAPRRARPGRRPQPRPTATPRRCGRSTTTRPASPGSTPTTTRTTCSRFLRRGRTAGRWRASSNFAGVPHHGYRLGLP